MARRYHQRPSDLLGLEGATALYVDAAAAALGAAFAEDNLPPDVKPWPVYDLGNL